MNEPDANQPLGLKNLDLGPQDGFSNRYLWTTLESGTGIALDHGHG
jgi:hypothetical protein